MGEEKLTGEEVVQITFNSFPDSLNQSQQGQQMETVFFFRLRRSAWSGDSGGRGKEGGLKRKKDTKFLYCFVCFAQMKDPRVKFVSFLFFSFLFFSFLFFSFLFFSFLFFSFLFFSFLFFSSCLFSFFFFKFFSHTFLLRRGYVQKSVVLVTKRGYVGLYKKLIRTVGASFFSSFDHVDDPHSGCDLLLACYNNILDWFVFFLLCL